MALKFSEECAPLVADATGAYPEEEAGAYPWGTGLWLYVEEEGAAGAGTGVLECGAGAELGAGCICAGPGCCLKMGS
jgi:hypothetical protein